jgi:hypothetical protein
LFACADTPVDHDCRYCNPSVPDVEAAFAAIPTRGQALGVWSAGLIEYPFYSFNRDHDNWGNHFQGIQRLRNSNYVVISGGNIANQGDLSHWDLSGPGQWGDMSDPAASLFVARLASRPERGPFGTNIDPSSVKPDESDRLIIDLELGGPVDDGNYLWHPGGISVVGDLVVISVENYLERLGKRISQIVFVDVSDPEHPEVLDQSIDRTRGPLVEKAGAAAMVHLDDGRFLVAARSTRQLFFYPSRTARFEDGFDESAVVVFDEKRAKTANGLERTAFGGSTINFLRQSDGRIYLVTFGFDRTPDTIGDPSVPGRHFADLYLVEFPRGNLRKRPTITKVARREFGDPALDPAGWGHFSAAAGIYVTDEGKLAVYGAYYFQVDQIGEVNLTNLQAGRFFEVGNRGFVPMIEYWPGAQSE